MLWGSGRGGCSRCRRGDGCRRGAGARARRDRHDTGSKLGQTAPVATVDEIIGHGAIIIGTPTGYGNMAARMKNFLDQTSEPWVQDKMVGGVVTSTGNQHGGEETTSQSTHTVLLRPGTAIIGLPCSFKGQMRMDEITDSLPCGASTLAGEGERQPSANELDGARCQGRHVAEVTRAIVLGRRHLLPQTTRSSTTSSTS